jgi:two-component system CheB/CheR fusion protein
MGLSILLIDDNPDDRALVERQLKLDLDDPRVLHAGTAEAFAHMLGAEDFDVAITDYQLRWSDGITVLHELKRRFPERPVIMFTGSGSEEVAVAAMKDGLDDYVTKTVKHYPRVPFTVRACVERAQQRKRLEEAHVRETVARARLEITLEAAGMGSWQVDLRNEEVSYSDALGPMFGHAPGFVHAGVADWAEAIHPDDRPAVLSAWDDAVRGVRPYRVEFRVLGADGVTRWIASTAKVLHDEAGAAILVVGSARDITSEVAIQDDLKRQRAELQEADRQKTEFLALLAHELRNPLAASGYSVAMLRRSAPPPQMRKAVDVIERQTAHMGKLLDDLLDVSRITRNRIELDLEPTDLRAIIDIAYENARPAVEAKRHRTIQTVAGEPLVVNGDEVRLTQVIGNLLHNAAKFTPPGGEIGIRAWHDDGNAVLEIADNGIGIEAARLGGVFDMFAQGHTKMHGGEPGLGVGLAVVSSLVELHGGSVSASSAGAGLGTRVRVTLPLAEAPRESTPAADPLPSPGLHPSEIVLADDNVDAADLLSELLRAEGYQVHTAYDGQAAYDLAEQCRPAILLLDIGMPRLNGYEVAHRVREHTWGETMSIIAVTGWGENQHAQSAGPGFDARLVKPVDFGQLLEVLERARTVPRALT